jgi:tRNA (mo5U34)-methyltransferase
MTELKDELENDVKSFPYWYHKIKLSKTVTTPGWAPLNIEKYCLPKDLTGKRVLDIGAWDGFWTFEALARNAKEVVAIDDFSDYLGKLKKEDRKAWDTFDFCKKTLGYDDSKCKRYQLDISKDDISFLGKFDLILFFGTFYHLQTPFNTLKRIRTLAAEKSQILIESAICDDFSPYTLNNKGHGHNMIMEFYPGGEYGNNETNWWVPTLRCLLKMVVSCGWAESRSWKLIDKPTVLAEARGFVSGRLI